jgi:hypothetical protein
MWSDDDKAIPDALCSNANVLSWIRWIEDHLCCHSSPTFSPLLYIAALL